MSENNVIILASGNQGKAREFRALLEPLGYEIHLQKEYAVNEAVEDGHCFIENALKKAYNAAVATGLPVLADDSGLAVDALNGAPGIYSSRFAGPHANDALNNQLLLERLSGLPLAQRTARYWCALVLVRGPEDPVPLTVLSSWKGQIGFAERGHNGFGYDPLFLPLDEEVLALGGRPSAAEIEPQLKDRLSHRGKALQKLLALLSPAHA